MAEWSAYDFSLTISGTQYHFMLADDENGLKLWREGTSPEVAEQLRSDAFSYTHVDPRFAVTSALDSWEGGAGYEIVTSTDGRVATYNYTQGVDLSWGARGYLSPELQTGGNTALPITKFMFSREFGLFGIADRYLFEWTGSAWTEREDLGEDVNAFVDIIEYSNTTDTYLIAGTDQVGSATYEISLDGVTWTTSDSTNDERSIFAIRSTASNEPVLWGIRYDTTTNTVRSLIANSVAPENSTGSWTAADLIGTSATNPNRILTTNNKLYVFKPNGIFRFDGTIVEDYFPARDTFHIDNGTKAVVWSNGFIYANWNGGTLIEIDPFNDIVRQVWPPTEGSSELNGAITAIAPSQEALYFAVKNAAGKTYIMRGDPNKGFHTMAYRGTDDCQAMLVVPPGEPAGAALSATNPTLVISTDATDGAHWYILPTTGKRPEDDSACRFDTAQGTLVGSFIDFGAKGMNKFLTRGEVLGFDLDSNDTIAIRYQVPKGTATTIHTANSNGFSGTDLSSEVSFSLVRHVALLDNGANTTTPVLDTLVLQSSPNPPKRYVYTPVVALLEDNPLVGGAIDGQSVDVLLAALRTAVNTHVTMRDRHGNTRLVRLGGYQVQGVKKSEVGGVQRDLMLVELTLIGLEVI